MPRIMEAHGIPYVASTSAAYPADLYDKVAKARGIKGLRYIHMNTPCPSGWGFDPKDTVRLGKLAVETGLTVLYEVEDGVFRLTSGSRSLARSGRRRPLAELIAAQRRFSGMTDDDIAEAQAWVDGRWEGFVVRDRQRSPRAE